MLLLTWHGTILRVEADSARIIQASLWPVRPRSTDLAITLPTPELTAPLSGPGESLLIPGPKPRTAHFLRGDRPLRAEPGAPYPHLADAAPGPWETFLLIEEAEAALLRDLLGHAWQALETGERVLPRQIALDPGFILRMGSWICDLTESRPAALDPAHDRCWLPQSPAPVTLMKLPAQGGWGEIELRPVQRPPLPLARDAEAFRITPGTRMRVEGRSERLAPPLVVSAGHRDWVATGEGRGWGTQRPACDILHEADRHVLLAPGAEGTVIGPEGLYAAPDDAARLRLVPGLSIDGEHLGVSRRHLLDAPFLPGNYVVFPCGPASGDADWLLRVVLPLTCMLPLLPDDVSLLIRAVGPGEPEPAYPALLESCGLGRLPRVELAEPMCEVASLFWLRCPPDRLPSEALWAVRERATAMLPPGGTMRRRLYVRAQGTGSVRHGPAMEKFVARQGFEICKLDALSPLERIALFNQAEFIIVPHGPAMTNILFCQPGTKILELSDSAAYRPVLGRIAAKLGLTHAVLPCRNDGSDFNRLFVNVREIGSIIKFLKARLP